MSRYRAERGQRRIGGPTKVPPAGRLRRLATEALTTDETAAIRALMELAFGDDEEERFEDADWEHAIGGAYVVLDLDGEIVAHAAVVERELHVAGRPLRTGYVEAVATAPDRQGEGHGTRVMAEIGAIIAEHDESAHSGLAAITSTSGWLADMAWAVVRPDSRGRPTDIRR